MLADALLLVMLRAHFELREPQQYLEWVLSLGFSRVSTGTGTDRTMGPMSSTRMMESKVSDAHRPP